jgi:serine/threonine protein kinase
MPQADSGRDLLEVLAEDFVERHRRGERPSLSEYTDRHPELADAIHELFPALVKPEPLEPASDAVTGPFAAQPPRARGAALERLGDYRILREVGRGGMGVVYEAEQVSLGRHVALKVLPAHSLLDPRHLVRFQREAKAARLHHTNIVPVYGVGEEDGVYYYVMQFIQGQPLDQVIAELGRLQRGRGSQPTASAGASPPAAAPLLLPGESPGRVEVAGSSSDGSGFPAPRSALSSDSGRAYWQAVARVGVQAAGALTHAHAQGVLHRDIKPSNLLLDHAGCVWITDFGLAKEADSADLTHTGDIVGTLRYMAPERFQGKADPRSDVYALGLTLYELLALRPAFDERDRNRLLQQILHDEPARLRALNPAVPRDLETVVLKAIERDPARRYPSAAELGEDLKRFLEDRPVRARQVTRRERFVRWCRRNPALAAASGAAALLAAVAVVSVIYGLAQQAAARREAADAQSLRRQERATARALTTSEERGKELGQAKQRNEQTLRDSARLALGRGLELAEQGEVNQGLLWMARALEIAPESEDALGRAIRLSLHDWQQHVPPVALTIPHLARTFQSEDGQSLAMADDRQVSLWDLSTGQGPVRLPLGAVLRDLRWSADGRVVLLMTGGATVQPSLHGKFVLRIYAAATGAPLGPPVTASFEWIGLSQAVALAPDGKSALLWTDRYLETHRLWDLATCS